jgi:hypothetical protein
LRKYIYRYGLNDSGIVREENIVPLSTVLQAVRQKYTLTKSYADGKAYRIAIKGYKTWLDTHHPSDAAHISHPIWKRMGHPIELNMK